MRNLKKVLSLVLCVAVMLSVMVVGAGAAFSDQGKIQNAEAVDACVALNIINGYDDGTYRPESNVTRAEVTKMICIALNGGKEPALGTVTTPTFNDVRTDKNSAWAEAYIESCVAQGIVAGTAPGKFQPSNSVTGTELAKMLLVSLGYKSENEGFIGNGWNVKVNTVASAKGLYEDLETIDVSAALTRDSAAQMIWNALNAYEVEYKTILTTENGQLTSQVVVQDKVVGDNNDKITLLEDKYEAVTNVGTLVNISGEDLTISMSTADQAESDYIPTGDAGTKSVTFTSLDQDYSALLGQKVKVLFKDGKLNDVLGVYSTDDNKVLINTTASNLDTVSGEKKVEVNNTKYTVDDNGLSIWTISVDSNGNAQFTKGIAKTTATDIANAVDAINDNDMPVTVISNNDNNKIDVILLVDKTFAKLTTVNSSSVSYKAVDLRDMKGETTGSAVKLDLGTDEPDIYSGYAKDDYVFVAADLYNEGLVITKAETVTGNCSAFKTDSIRIDGDWYDYAGGTFNAKADKSYTIYVYGSYAYYVTGESGSSSDVDVLLVKDVGTYQKLDGGVEAKVYFDTDQTQVINVERVVTPKAGFDLDDYDEDITSSTAWENTDGNAIADKLTDNTMYAYEQDGSDYTLFVLNNNFKSGDIFALVTDKDNDKTVSYNDKSETVNGYEADDAAQVYLTYSTDSYKILTGSSLTSYSSMTGSANSVALVDDDTVIAVYLNLGEDGISTTDTLYGVVMKSYKGTESNGSDTVIYLDLMTAEGKKTVETEETGSANKYTKGDIVSFTGTYELANDDIEIVSDSSKSGADDSQGYIAIQTYSDSSKLVRAYQDLAYNGKIVNVGAGKIVSDSTVICLDQSNTTYEAADATPSKAEELANGNGYYANAFMIVNSDNEIELLVYESNDRIKDGNNEEVELYGEATGTLASGTTADAIKKGNDGAFVPTDKTFANAENDVTGNANDNMIFKFTAPAAAKYTLTIYNDKGTEVYKETTSSDMSVGGHFFYICVNGASETAPNAGSGTYAKASFAKGTYSYDISGNGSSVLQGVFVIK